MSEKIKIIINGEEKEFEVSNPLGKNDHIEEINGKLYVVRYPEGTEFWDDKDFF